MAFLTLRHVTTCRFARPVRVGDQRLFVRPRTDDRVRVVGSRLDTDPPARRLSWRQDMHGNWVVVISFDGQATSLQFVCELRIEVTEPPTRPVLDPQVELYPFHYGTDELAELGRFADRHSPDPDGRVEEWARAVVVATPSRRRATLRVLERLTEAVGRLAPPRPGDADDPAPRRLQRAAETLERGHGSARDRAWLLVEAARSLGFASRYVAGYRHTPDQATLHAWAEIYLSGGGWLPLDPTGTDALLIPVAVARIPDQTLPLTASWIGGPDDLLGLEVEIAVETSAREGLVPDVTLNMAEHGQGRARTRTGTG